MADELNGAQRIRVWDIWVRLFHWSLAIAVLFQLLNGQTGWQFFQWHRQTGELILALILFRVFWGIVGSSNARLASLFRHPLSAWRHLRHLLGKSVTPERGHNAAGGWAVLIMLSLIAVQALTGFFIADEDELIEGALYGKLSGGSTDLLYQVHRMNANLIQVVVAVHVLMVMIYLLYSGMNLIGPMVTGSMRWTSSITPPPVSFQKAWVGLSLVALSLALVAWLAGWIG
ncbi:MAG: hydrogenase [Granulosicoccus sp.]|nr:hydrogenase [Granulosicoccus sp.]